MTWDTLLLAVIANLFGLYEITHGIYTSRRYGLRFLLIGGVLTGLPFIAVGWILVIGGGRSIGGWEYLVLVVWLFGVAWETWQKRKHFRSNPGGELEPYPAEAVEQNEGVDTAV